MIIRKAVKEDLEDILVLFQMLFEYEIKKFNDKLNIDWPFTIEGRKEFLNQIQNYIVFIAEVDSKIVGYLSGTVRRVNHLTITRGRLESMYVMEEYRGINIGTMLIKEFERYCKLEGAKGIVVSALSENKKAIDFYKKNLFEDYSTVLKYDFKEAL